MHPILVLEMAIEKNHDSKAWDACRQRTWPGSRCAHRFGLLVKQAWEHTENRLVNVSYLIPVNSSDLSFWIFWIFWIAQVITLHWNGLSDILIFIQHDSTLDPWRKAFTCKIQEVWLVSEKPASGIGWQSQLFAGFQPSWI